MTDPAAYHDAIEQYLLGQMPPDERAAFEQELANNPDMAALLKRQKQEHAAMQLLVDDHLRAKLDAWKIEPPQPGPGTSALRYWVLAALIVLVVVLVFLLKWYAPSPAPPPLPEAPSSPEQPIARPHPDAAPEPLPVPRPPETPGVKPARYIALARKYEEPIRFSEGAMRQADDRGDSLGQALRLLDAGRYAPGLAILNSIPAGHPGYKDARYYQALAYYRQGKFPRAISFLETAAADPDFLHAEKAAWYLVLIYLQTGQVEKGKILARYIAADDGHRYQGKAERLLKDLANLK